MAAASAEGCINAMVMNYLAVISVHRKLNKRMCLSTSVAEVNKALRKALMGVRGGKEGMSEPDLENTDSCSCLR